MLIMYLMHRIVCVLLVYLAFSPLGIGV